MSDVDLTLINNFIFMFSTKHFSTNSKNKTKKRKSLKSPESNPYKNLYLGKLKIEPDWVIDNGEERSPFGCSWSKKERGINPIKTKLEHHNIDDPFNNRKKIKKICRGKRVVYIRRAYVAQFSTISNFTNLNQLSPWFVTGFTDAEVLFIPL